MQSVRIRGADLRNDIVWFSTALSKTAHDTPFASNINLRLLRTTSILTSFSIARKLSWRASTLEAQAKG
jgi:hypothetical protein